MEHDILWGPIRSTLSQFSFGDIKQIIGYAGIDMTQLAHLEQKHPGGATKSQLLSAIDQQIAETDPPNRKKIAEICCEKMLHLRGHR